MKNNILKIFILVTILFLGSCETFDLDQTEDPSKLNESLLNPVLAFNYVQLQLPDFVNSANSFTQRVTRQMAMTGGNTYENAFAPVNFDNNWSTGFNILNTIKIMEPKAIENQEYYALGAAKVIRCYVLMTMVDIYGDIPYTEALQGSNNLTPKYDSSASVYKNILLELDDAIVTLGETNNSRSEIQDLYYTSQSNWITLANTLKLKLLCTARLAGSDIDISDVGAEISTILANNDYIDNPTEDFEFRYGNSRFTPNSRHPLYNDQYETGGGAYIGNYMMWTMTSEKGTGFNNTSTVTSPGDPRVPFYFFKQDADPSDYLSDIFTLPGRIRPEHYNNTEYVSFYDASIRTCYTVSNWIGGTLPADGFWGRDHGNNSGIPPDAEQRTVAGIYPIGGAYGSAASVQTNGSKGLTGAGIMPILLSSYVRFMKAEAILKLGVTGDAKAELLAGISESIAKSTKGINIYPGLSATQLTTINTGINTKTTSYLNFIGARYDSFDTDKKLELIIKEFYIASWGNGIEPYNNYRRTGYPSNFQPTLEPISGAFYSAALYPGNAVNNNPNTPANLRTRKVFWDKANLILN